MDMGRLVYWAILIVDGHGRSARWIDRRGPEQSRPPHSTLFSRGPPRKSREASDPKKKQVTTGGETPVTIPFISLGLKRGSQTPLCPYQHLESQLMVQMFLLSVGFQSQYSASSFIIPIMRHWSGPAAVVWLLWSQ